MFQWRHIILNFYWSVYGFSFSHPFVLLNIFMTLAYSWMKCTCTEPCNIFMQYSLKQSSHQIWNETSYFCALLRRSFYLFFKWCRILWCHNFISSVLLYGLNHDIDIRPLLHDKSQLIMSCKLRIEHLSWCVPKYTRLVVVVHLCSVTLVQPVLYCTCIPSVPFGSSLQLIASVSVQILSAERVSFLQVALVGGKTSTIGKRGKLFISCLLVHREGKFVFCKKDFKLSIVLLKLFQKLVELIKNI